MIKEELEQFGFKETTLSEFNGIKNNLFRDFFEEVFHLKPNTSKGTYDLTLSSYYGLGQFPYHTDGANRLIPPKWIILVYNGIIKSKSRTLLFDTKQLIFDLAYEDIFYNEIYSVKYSKTNFITPLVNKLIYKEPIFRWNNLLMKKLNKKSEKELVDLIVNPTETINWEEGKVLIIDNWRMLHSREAIEIDEVSERNFTRINLTPQL